MSHKIIDEYYVQVIDEQGATYGYGGPFRPTNYRMFIEVYARSNGDIGHRGDDRFHSYPSDLVHQITTAARNSAGVFNDRFSWIKE